MESSSCNINITILTYSKSQFLGIMLWTGMNETLQQATKMARLHVVQISATLNTTNQMILKDNLNKLLYGAALFF